MDTQPLKELISTVGFKMTEFSFLFKLFSIFYIILSEKYLPFEKQIDYDQVLGKKAEDLLNGEDWSDVFFVYLEAINFDGVWEECFNDEKAGIRRYLAENFPEVEIVDRLVVQWCATLANLK